MRLIPLATLWCIDAGPAGEAEELFLQQNRIALAWPKAGDLRESPADLEQLSPKLAESYPGKLPGVYASAADQLINFAHHAQVGDWIIYPSIHDQQLHLGRIDGDYVYDPAAKYAHQREVHWVKTISRDSLRPAALSELESARAFFAVEDSEPFILDKREPWKINRWVAGVVLVIAAVLPYVNSLGGSFHFDDPLEIASNEHIRSFSGLLSARPIGRWLTFATFYVNYRLGGLDSMAGWHIVNILLHAGTVLALYWVLKLLMPAGGRVAAVPFWGALLFAVHPLASEPVNYISARSVTLYTLFSLLALAGAAVIHRAPNLPRRVGGVALLAGSIVLAALSKEVGIFFATLLPVLYLLLFVPGTVTNKRALWLSMAGGAAALGVIGGVWLSVSGTFHGMAARIDDRFGSYVWGQMTVFWRYMLLAIWPHPSALSVDHYVAYAVGTAGDAPSLRKYALANWDVLLSTAGIVAVVLLAGALAIWRRPYAALWLLVLPLGVLPYFLLPNDEMMVEYRFYLPLAAFCAVAGIAMAELGARMQPLGGGLVACLCVVLAWGTIERSAAWKSDVSLWADAVVKAPRKARTVSALADALLKDTDARSGDPEVLAALVAIRAQIKDKLPPQEAAGWANIEKLHVARPKLALVLAELPFKKECLDAAPFNPFIGETLAEAQAANGDIVPAIQNELSAIAQVVKSKTPVPKELYGTYVRLLDQWAANNAIDALRATGQLIRFLQQNQAPVPAVLQAERAKLVDQLIVSGQDPSDKTPISDEVREHYAALVEQSAAANLPEALRSLDNLVGFLQHSKTPVPPVLQAEYLKLIDAVGAASAGQALLKTDALVRAWQQQRGAVPEAMLAKFVKLADSVGDKDAASAWSITQALVGFFDDNGATVPPALRAEAEKLRAARGTP